MIDAYLLLILKSSLDKETQKLSLLGYQRFDLWVPKAEDKLLYVCSATNPQLKK